MNTALEELKKVEARAKELRESVSEDVTTRMKEIVSQINSLVKEGVELADNSRLMFDLSGLDFLPYGSGGLCYNPVQSEWDEQAWQTSSMSC